jgi:hypothetical protein
MRYLKSWRERVDPAEENEPLIGLANLMDLGLVFVVGLVITLFSVFHLQDLFSQKADLTLLKRNSKGELELIEKKGREIKSLKLSTDKAQGLGERLGIAYRLQDGTYVYVPEKDLD